MSWRWRRGLAIHCLAFGDEFVLLGSDRHVLARPPGSVELIRFCGIDVLLTPIRLIVRGNGSLDNAEAFEHALIIGGLDESYVLKHIVRNQQPIVSRWIEIFHWVTEILTPPTTESLTHTNYPGKTRNFLFCIIDLIAKSKLNFTWKNFCHTELLTWSYVELHTVLTELLKRQWY